MKMRTVLLVCAVAAVAATACGSSSSAPPPACPPDNPDCREAATAEAGGQEVADKNCQKCHTPNMAGSTVPLTADAKGNPLAANVKLYPPNLTNDPDTGIGKWTDDQLAIAIRNGIDNESLQLCPQMSHFSQMTDFQAYSVVKWLRSIPAVKNDVPRSVCPPLKN